MKRIVLGLSFVAVLAGCAKGQATPGETVQEFTSRLYKGECVGLGNYIAKNNSAGPAAAVDFGDRITRVCTTGIEERKSMAVAEQDKEQLRQANILDTRENNDRAIVKVEFETRAGEKLPPQLIALARSEGLWRIDLDRTRMLSFAPADNIPDPAAEPPMMGPPPMMMPPGADPSMGPPPGPGEGPEMGPPPADAPSAAPPTQPTPAER